MNFLGFLNSVSWVDRVANIMPWAGSAIPAVMTYQSVQGLGFEIWQAAIIGGVVEGLGFVTVTTTVDIYEANQVRKSSTWDNQADGTFFVSLGATGVYALVVVLINAFLHEGSMEQKITLALLSLFGLLGGLMVALRNQLGKRLTALETTKAAQEADKAEAQRQAKEREQREWEAQQAREREERAQAMRLTEEKMRLAHEERMAKIAEKARQEAQKVSETFQKAQESSAKVAQPDGKFPETYGKWKDWRKVPASERKVIATFTTPEQVQESYGGSLKTCANWLENAHKEYGKPQ